MTILEVLVGIWIVELIAVVILGILLFLREPEEPHHVSIPDAPPDDFGPQRYVESGVQPGKVYEVR